MTPQELLVKWNEKTADNRTETEQTFDATVEAEWAKYDAEIAPIMAANDPQKWEKAEGIAQRYREAGIIKPIIVLNA